MGGFHGTLAIRHFVSPTTRGRIILVGDASSVWCGLVRMQAKAAKVNEIAKSFGPVGAGVDWHSRLERS